MTSRASPATTTRSGPTDKPGPPQPGGPSSAVRRRTTVMLLLSTLVRNSDSRPGSGRQVVRIPARVGGTRAGASHCLCYAAHSTALRLP